VRRDGGFDDFFLESRQTGLWEPKNALSSSSNCARKSVSTTLKSSSWSKSVLGSTRESRRRMVATVCPPMFGKALPLIAFCMPRHRPIMLVPTCVQVELTSLRLQGGRLILYEDPTVVQNYERRRGCKGELSGMHGKLPVKRISWTKRDGFENQPGEEQTNSHASNPEGSSTSGALRLIHQQWEERHRVCRRIRPFWDANNEKRNIPIALQGDTNLNRK